MSLDLFRVTHGLAIEDDGFETGVSSNAYVLQGNGAPGGDAGREDEAPIGSLYMRTDVETNNLQVYYKWSTVNNSSADWRLVADKNYVDNVAKGLSWREPVRVHDATLYADSSAFPTTGTIDGVVLADRDRVLFSNVNTSGEENVWIWDATGSSWTEDANVETDGDALMVQEGTSAEQQWVYDGTTWVQIASASGSAELGYIRNFIGKDGIGAESPVYTSTNVVTQNTTLEAAIGSLDGAFGDGEITNDQTDVPSGLWALTNDLDWTTRTVTTALNELNEAIGDRQYAANNAIADGETLSDSLDKLDVAIGSGDITNTGGNWAINGDLDYTTRTVTTALNELNDQFGDGSHATTNVVTDGNDVTSNFEAIDATFGVGTITNQGGDYPLSDDMLWDTANSGTLTLTSALNAINNAVGVLNDQTQEITATNVNLTNTVIDSIPTGDATEIKWMVQMRRNGSPANRRAFEIHAMHNNAAADHNIFSRLVLGTGVDGVSFSVDVNGGNFRLLASASGAVDYVVKRVSYSAF